MQDVGYRVDATVRGIQCAPPKSRLGLGLGLKFGLGLEVAARAAHRTPDPEELLVER